MLAKLLLFCYLAVSFVLAASGVNDINPDLEKEISLQIKQRNGTVLSRKRRYLMFPSGSSFQLVFCLTYPSVAIGSYFVFGHTAALAWELPSMPLFFDQRDFQKKEEEEPAETTTTEMHPDFSELDHKIVGSDYSSWDVPYDKLNKKIDDGLTNLRISDSDYYKENTLYKNPFMDFIKKPGFSAIGDNNMQNALEQNPNIYHLKGYRKNINLWRYDNWKSHMRLDMDPKYFHTHRRTRRDLYSKIENFLNTLNLDGKSCLLKAICEISKSTNEKETFMQEVFKTVFRAKPHDEHGDEDEYDVASNPEYNCTEIYSSCKGSLRKVQLLVRK